MMKNPGYDMDKDLTLVSIIPGAFYTAPGS